MRNIIIGLALLVVSITFFLISAEGVARLYDTYFASFKLTPSEYDSLSRLQGYTLEKKSGIFRILVLGDSIAYGQGIKGEQTFSKVLENLLNKNADKIRFEVINTGFCGINTGQELSILLNKGPAPETSPELANEGYQGLAYSPDLIILQYTVSNDAEATDLPGKRRFGNRTDSVRRQNYGDYAIPLPDPIDKWLTIHSKFYLFILTKYHGLLSKLGLRSEIGRVKAMYGESANGWLMSKNALYSIGSISRGYKIPAILVIWATGDAGPLSDIHSLIGETSQRYGFYVIDLAKSVKWPSGNFAVSKTDGHPNAKAHAIAGEALFNFIKEQKLVP